MQTQLKKNYQFAEKNVAIHKNEKTTGPYDVMVSKTPKTGTGSIISRYNQIRKCQVENDDQLKSSRK